MAGLKCENHPRCIITQPKDADYKPKNKRTLEEDTITCFRNIPPSSSRGDIYNVLSSNSSMEGNKDHHHRLFLQPNPNQHKLERRTVYFLAVGDTASYKIRFKPKFEKFWRFSVRGFDTVQQNRHFILTVSVLAYQIMFNVSFILTGFLISRRWKKFMTPMSALSWKPPCTK